jgi:predicted nicotinamide N-methyase
MFFSLCIGNEFGLWNRSLIDGTSTNFIKWEVFPAIPDLELESADGHDGNRVLQGDGRVRVRLRFAESSLVCPPKNEFYIKFSLVAPLSSGAVVVPVCSLPITVVSSSDEAEKLVAETKITEAGQRGQFLSCIRSITLGQGGEIFGYEAQGSLGIGGKLWDSTWVLIDYLESNPEILCDLDVLELGAGTGIAGIALNSACGCKSMMLTDFPEVCELLRMNVSLNEKLRMLPTKGRVSVMPLCWGEDSLPVANNRDFGVNSEKKIGGIDAIIASDVVYDPTGYLPLAKTLRSLISGNTFCILAHRSRHPEEYKFFSMITEDGSGMRMSRISHTNNSPLLSDVQLFRIVAAT